MTTSTMITATIFGMKVSVDSLICVMAWRTLTTIPIAIAAMSSGPAR